jgi:hypothetical protein
MTRLALAVGRRGFTGIVARDASIPSTSLRHLPRTSPPVSANPQASGMKAIRARIGISGEAPAGFPDGEVDLYLADGGWGQTASRTDPTRASGCRTHALCELCLTPSLPRGAANETTTSRARSIATSQVPLPAQSPLHPAKIECGDRGEGHRDFRCPSRCCRARNAPDHPGDGHDPSRATSQRRGASWLPSSTGSASDPTAKRERRCAPRTRFFETLFARGQSPRALRATRTWRLACK